MKSDLRNVVNYSFDRVVRPEVVLFGSSHCAFKLCGGVGLFVAVALVTWLCALEQRSLFVVTALFASSVLTFLTLAMATKIVAGGERLVLYHHKLAVLSVAALVLWALSAPVLPYLDLLVIGVGTFISFGRIGCLLVGCCHGRPYPWGVSYRHEHADAGLRRFFVGVRLFPVQAVESILTAGIVLSAAWFVLRGYPQGSALSSYIVAYAILRFCCEFMRGDSERPYLAAVSEAQWTSVALVLLTVFAEITGLLPFTFWHSIAAVVLVMVTVLSSIKRSLDRQLTHPLHLKEIAETIEEIRDHGGSNEDDRILVYRTSLGLLLSAGKLRGESGEVAHYVVSLEDKKMDERAARVVAELIRRLGQYDGPSELIAGPTAVYHLLTR